MRFVYILVLLGLVAARMKPIIDEDSEFLKAVMGKKYDQVAALSQTDAVNDKTKEHVGGDYYRSHMLGSHRYAYCDTNW